MLALVITIALGVVFSVFATQNTSQVSLNFGKYAVSGVPLYLVVLGPLLLGLIVAYLIYLTRKLSQGMLVNKQRDEIKNLKKELAEVTRDAHKFELESTKLKAENGEPEDENSI